MGVQLQLTLTVCIVNFALLYVQSKEEIAYKIASHHQVYKTSEKGKNFHNLLNSLGKNDTNKREFYHKVLNQEVVKEKHAFDAMKEELMVTRHRHSNTNGNFKQMDSSRNIVAAKREIYKNNRDTDDFAFNGEPDTSKELPGKLDKFEDLRANNRIYVDKTHYVTKLLKQKFRFLSICRPKQFGKSNFLQMLKAFFLGNQTLFEGLDIYNKHSWQTNPVIYLDFTIMSTRTVEEFKTDLDRTLRQIGESYGHTLSATQSTKTLLDELMYELSGHAEKFESIIILINEYDWPVRQNGDIDNKVEVWEVSSFLREFFQEMKTFSDKIKMLILTCTIPLQLRNFKGGLDFVKDITYDSEYSDMIGLTDSELKSNFKSHIDKLVTDPKVTFDSIVQDLRKHYGGYCFSTNTNSTCRMYNFHSAISAMRNKNITNYWHPNENPKYNMISAYQKEEYQRHIGTLSSFTNFTLSKRALQTQMDVNNPSSLIMSMVIYGYLTFRDYKEDKDEFILDFPNEEVREKFIKQVLEPTPLGTLPVNKSLEECKTLRQTMFGDKKTEEFIEKLNKMAFSTESHNEAVNAKQEKARGEAEDGEEGEEAAPVSNPDYPDHIIRVFQICDIKNHYSFTFFRKDFTTAGRIGLTAEEINNSNQLYVFEFAPIEDAMKKLLNFAKMPEFWRTFTDRKIYLMGLVLSKEAGTIQEWIRVTYENGRFNDLRTSNPEHKKKYLYITNTKTTTEAVLGLNTFI